MKKKVLGYRLSGNGDAVVSRYRELEKIADGLYAFLYDKSETKGQNGQNAKRHTIV